MSSQTDAKQVQAMHPDAHRAAPTKATASRYHDFFRAMPFEHLASLLDCHDLTAENKHWLIAGCGRGTDLHYLSGLVSARWTAIDISCSATCMTKSAFPSSEVLVADLEHLPFHDDEFEVGFAAATLHHLRRPMVGLYELLRVSRQLTILIEPNDSWLTRLATRLGVAHEYEAEGNYVYRFGASDLRRVAKAASYTAHIDRFFATHRVAKSDAEFLALKTVNRMANAVAPRLGNYIVTVLEK